MKKNNKIRIFRESLQNQAYVLLPFFIFSITVIIGYFFYNKSFAIDLFTLRVGLVIFSIFLIPLLILHLDYLINDWSKKLIINYETKEIIYEKKQVKISFSFNDLEYICFHGETKGFNTLIFDQYYFYKIKIKNQEPFLVSCFMVRNLDKYINFKIKKIRSLFPVTFLGEEQPG